MDVLFGFAWAFGLIGTIFGIIVIIYHLYKNGNLKYIDAETKTVATISLITMILCFYGFMWIDNMEPKVETNIFITSEYKGLKLGREECIKQVAVSRPLSADLNKVTAEIVPMEKCRKGN